jgi:hypothetical protein
MTATAELTIRSRRAAFNRAIAEGETAAIGPLLAHDCILVTGTDSAVIAGRLAQVKVWTREFAAPHRLVYARMPGAITVSSVEPIAQEQGEWQGSDKATGVLGASGIYTAKWRDVGGQWVIEAEIFVTLG